MLLNLLQAFKTIALTPPYLSLTASVLIILAIAFIYKLTKAL